MSELYMASRRLMQIFWTLPTLFLGCLCSLTTCPMSGIGLPLLTPKWKAPFVNLIWSIPSLCYTYKGISLVSFLPFAHTLAGAQLVEQDISGHLSCSLQVYQKINPIPRNTVISVDYFLIWLVQDMCREKREMVYTGFSHFRDLNCRISPVLKIPVPRSTGADTADLMAPRPFLRYRKHSRSLFRDVIRLLPFSPAHKPTGEVSIFIDIAMSIPSFSTH